MDNIEKIEAFVAHREVGGYRDARIILRAIVIFGCSIGSVIIYKNIFIISVSTLCTILFIWYLKVLFVQKKEDLYLFESLQGALVIIPLTEIVVALILLSGKSLIVMKAIMLLWIVTGIAKVLSIKIRIEKGYYADYKRTVSTLATDIAVGAVIPMYLLYHFFSKQLNLYFGMKILGVEILPFALTLVVLHMVEDFCIHYYVKKYDLVKKIRVM